MQGTQAGKKEIRRITNIIIRQYKPEKIILFGSYAWGKPTKDSDLDFFVVKKTKATTLKRLNEVGGLFMRRLYPMDFLVYTPDQIRRRLAMGDFFVKDVIRKGKLLYDRAGVVKRVA